MHTAGARGAAPVTVVLDRLRRGGFIGESWHRLSIGGDTARCWRRVISLSFGFWHRSWGVVAERHRAVRVEGLARVRRRTPCRLTAASDAPSGARRSMMWSAVDGDGSGHADRCTVLGLSGAAGTDEVYVEAVSAAFGTIEVVVRGRAGGSACPDCGRFSDRVHDRHQRRLKDLPLAEQGFVIRLTVRRFICGSADCPRRTFAEPFSPLAAPYARFTTRLNHALERVGLALAGRAGARLAARLGFGAGRMTLLRRVMARENPRIARHV